MVYWRNLWNLMSREQHNTVNNCTPTKFFKKRVTPRCCGEQLEMVFQMEGCRKEKLI